jgi:hypothetical protein
MISKIQTVAAQYKNRMAKISPDLKDSVQKQMRDDVHRELRPHLAVFRGQVDAMVKGFAETRKKNLDRRFLVAARSTNSIKDLTLGESRLMDIIATAPASVLSGIIAENKAAGFHGLVRLALLNRADALTNLSNKATTAAGAAEAKAGREIGEDIIDAVLNSEGLELDTLRNKAAQLSGVCLAMADLADAAQEQNIGIKKKYQLYAAEVVNQTQDDIENLQKSLPKREDAG